MFWNKLILIQLFFFTFIEQVENISEIERYTNIGNQNNIINNSSFPKLISLGKVSTQLY